MSIKISKPAIISSVVATERTGYRSWGIGIGGAMDFFAMSVANFLVGNDRQAVIEMGYSSSEIFVEQDLVIGVTGKGVELRVDEKIIPLWRPVTIKKNSLLKLLKKNDGAWAYLAVHGGWVAEEWLGSLTTNFSASKGGFQGRVFHKNDVIACFENSAGHQLKILPWTISAQQLDEVYSPSHEIRCLPSVETALLSEWSKQKFTSEDFVISPQSNRMGYRLSGPSLLLNQKLELVSSPVDAGMIQLLPDGNLITLMADCQTTGGYPRVASVIKADLPKLAQCMPGEKIRFKMISLQEAEQQGYSFQNQLAELKRSCHLQFKNYFH
ncbi:MAG: Allophanate hydrolase 2 subunit 2 [Cytophagales bacterium]|jgi:antagonist of KipI|nr:biotin-dependent carboxyltransferase family protein [Bacteroidota bacterium]MBS1981006.1 biotin-dependent carboxyltransferase family protein [Bacteroidota bacterium]WHZ08367.1 MAG: Allophanate hydrolase 2 subunit 2 [Cytophagales bacterium]